MNLIHREIGGEGCHETRRYATTMAKVQWNPSGNVKIARHLERSCHTQLSIKQETNTPKLLQQGKKHECGDEIWFKNCEAGMTVILVLRTKLLTQKYCWHNVKKVSIV